MFAASYPTLRSVKSVRHEESCNPSNCMGATYHFMTLRPVMTEVNGFIPSRGLAWPSRSAPMMRSLPGIGLSRWNVDGQLLGPSNERPEAVTGCRPENYGLSVYSAGLMFSSCAGMKIESPVRLSISVA
jgi:hypothetical protein